ncbi:MAG: RidA family protein [Elusimicrobiota bacterium]
MKTIIQTEKAPKAIGPYSQAIASGKLLFVSGQLPVKSDDGSMPAEIELQTETALNNLMAVAEKAGASLENVLKTTVFMTDLSLFSRMNEVYARFFPKNPPARSTVEVRALPKGAKIEIEAVIGLP